MLISRSCRNNGVAGKFGKLRQVHQQALEAAIKINQELARVSDKIKVRVSLHQGPCLAVNLNTGVDYFGSVVNEAAKLQGIAEGEEVALSEKLIEQPGIQSVVNGHQLISRRVEFSASGAGPSQSAAVLCLRQTKSG